MPDVLPALRAHLATQSILRPPGTVGSPLPPLWLEPRRGVPAPGDGAVPERHADAVVGAFLSGGMPPEFGEGYSRRDTIDFQLRVARAPLAKSIEEQLSAELAPFPLGARHAWQMADLFVIESRMWRALQPLGADEQSYLFTVSYLLETYRA